MEKKKFYQTTWFLWVCGIIFPIVGIILLWTVHKEKTKGYKIGLTVVFALWMIIALALGGGGSTETENTNAETVQADIESSAPVEVAEQTSEEVKEATEETKEEAVEEATVDELDALKAELKEKYDVSEPSPFVRGDTTGKWRIVKVANATPPSDYAVDYARAYMQDGDVHYIVNFSLKTTSQFTQTFGKLAVKTTEYVDKEEHDASIIGEGMLLTEHYYDMETGEEVTTEGNESAGTVEKDELISAVNEAIDGAIGEGEKISDVSFDGDTLTVKVDMSGADTSHLSAELIAESRVSSITDDILKLDDKYYNTWNKITVDFGDIGSISFGKNEVKDQGLGRYFEVPIGCFE